MEEEKCIFCMIASKKVPAKEIYEDPMIMGVLDINPASKGHVIMIPKKHYNNIYEMPQEEFLQYLSVARAVGYAILLSLAPNNVEMLYTKELTKGSVTPHALIHLIPRYNDDTVNHVWQPQKMEENDFTAVENAIKSAIEKVKSTDVQKPVKPANEEQKKPENVVKENKPQINIPRKVVVF